MSSRVPHAGVDSWLRDTDRITLSQGSGGRAMTELIEQVFLSAYAGEGFSHDDSALVSVGQHSLAFTTDSFVVDPIFFPGGDIGRLAIAGTVNDLLTAGAKPLAISAAFIIEEGFEVGDLSKIAASMRDTAREAGVRIVTGDTKVVPRGSADKVILTGTIGDHGTAVMLAREKLLDTESIASDVAPLTEIVLRLMESECRVHAMRDPTRGGIASSLNEIAAQSQVSIEVDETLIRVKPAVNAACEALGIEPYSIANEGKMLIIVAPEDADRALEIVRSSHYGEEAAINGEVRIAPPGRVTMKTAIGTSRLLQSPAGELLPRIC